MYATFINEIKIEKAPNIITVNGYRIINPRENDYIQAGYLEVREEKPTEEVRKWYEYHKRYELKDGYIREYYIEVKVPCPDYAEEVSNRIRQRYSQNDVEAIILNGTDTEEHTQEYNELQSYRAEIKAEVKAEIEEWEQA